MPGITAVEVDPHHLQAVLVEETDLVVEAFFLGEHLKLKPDQPGQLLWRHLEHMLALDVLH